MNQVTFEIESNEEVWELIDKDLDTIFIQGFSPNEIFEWWNIDLKIKEDFVFKKLSVRQLEMDVQTDLKELKRILSLNVNQFKIFQFDKAIPDSLNIEKLIEMNQESILQKNGMKHYFTIDFEMITVRSFSTGYIKSIELNPIFEKRILDRKNL